MVIGVSHWSRRDQADRALLGQAAYDVCKAMKSSDAVRDTRFYWAGPDTVVLQMTVEDARALVHPPDADCARALFALADLATRDRFEEWIDPRTGLEQYEMAGR